MKLVKLSIVTTVMAMAAATAMAANVPVASTGWSYDPVLEVGEYFTYNENPQESYFLGRGIGRFFETGRYQDGSDNDYVCLPAADANNIGTLATSTGNSYSIDYGQTTGSHKTSGPDLGLSMATLSLGDSDEAPASVMLTLDSPGQFESLSLLGWSTTGVDATIDVVVNEGESTEADLGAALFRDAQNVSSVPSASYDGYYFVETYRDYRGGSHINTDGAYMTEAIFDLSALGLDDVEVSTISMTITSDSGDAQLIGLAGTVIPEPATLSVLAIAGLGLIRRRH